MVRVADCDCAVCKPPAEWWMPGVLCSECAAFAPESANFTCRLIRTRWLGHFPPERVRGGSETGRLSSAYRQRVTFREFAVPSRGAKSKES
jgi:hypothetical protein